MRFSNFQTRRPCLSSAFVKKHRGNVTTIIDIKNIITFTQDSCCERFKSDFTGETYVVEFPTKTTCCCKDTKRLGASFTLKKKNFFCARLRRSHNGTILFWRVFRLFMMAGIPSTRLSKISNKRIRGRLYVTGHSRENSMKRDRSR